MCLHQNTQSHELQYFLAELGDRLLVAVEAETLYEGLLYGSCDELEVALNSI